MLRQSNHNHNHNYNLMGFDTIEINLVCTKHGFDTFRSLSVDVLILAMNLSFWIWKIWVWYELNFSIPYIILFYVIGSWTLWTQNVFFCGPYFQKVKYPLILNIHVNFCCRLRNPLTYQMSLCTLLAWLCIDISPGSIVLVDSCPGSVCPGRPLSG